MTGDNVYFWNWNLLEVKKNSNRIYKTGSWYKGCFRQAPPLFFRWESTPWVTWVGCRKRGAGVQSSVKNSSKTTKSRFLLANAMALEKNF